MVALALGAVYSFLRLFLNLFLRIFLDSPGIEPGVLGFLKALFEHAFFHIWEVGGTVENAERLLTIRYFLLEHVHAPCISVTNNDAIFTRQSHDLVHLLRREYR